MNGSRALGFASLPAAAGLAWHRYRQAAREIDAHPAVAPDLPGERRHLATRWGSVAYRWVPGDPTQPPLVLVHGWGKTADSAWWPVVADCSRTMVVLDLPGHGQSELEEPFTFELAAEALERVVEDSGVYRPVLVGHSMGGPVVLTSVRRAGAAAFSGVVALATSAYWVRPRLRVMMAMAPFVMAQYSPVFVHRQRAELRKAPEMAHHIAWAYTRRPVRRLLQETAAELRRFDARTWDDLEMPPTTWVVTADDGVLSPDHQRASARWFNAEMVEVPLQHSLVVQDPAAALAILSQPQVVGRP